LQRKLGLETAETAVAYARHGGFGGLVSFRGFASWDSFLERADLLSRLLPALKLSLYRLAHEVGSVLSLFQQPATKAIARKAIALDAVPFVRLPLLFPRLGIGRDDFDLAALVDRDAADVAALRSDGLYQALDIELLKGGWAAGHGFLATGWLLARMLVWLRLRRL
jgi:hypothetical protein